MDGGVAFREGLLLPFVGSPFFESDLLAASQFTLLPFLSFFFVSRRPLRRLTCSFSSLSAVIADTMDGQPATEGR